jgi:c-di-GMP-binding flagellar brake protein YcgR
MMNPAASHDPEQDALTQEDADYDKCMLYDAASIRIQLQKLIDKRCTLTAIGESGAVSLLTAPLAIEGDILWVDIPSSQEVLDRVLKCARLSFVGALDQVSMRFSSGPPVLGIQDSRPALHLPLPDRLLHLQRREIMRREPPPGALTCIVPGRGRTAGIAISTTIRDIGGGGLAVLVADDAMVLATGDLLPGCRIALPGLGVVEVTLRVCHVRHVQQRGKDVLQAGCQFIDLPPADQSKLFRYLMQLDREQLARRRERE